MVTVLVANEAHITERYERINGRVNRNLVSARSWKPVSLATLSCGGSSPPSSAKQSPGSTTVAQAADNRKTEVQLFPGGPNNALVAEMD